MGVIPFYHPNGFNILDAAYKNFNLHYEYYMKHDLY